MSFNIYFERGPTVAPGGSCLNPPSTTTIKCALWGGPVSAGDAVNTGQPREQFKVVIAGSNGYTSNSVASVPGYGPAQAYGNAAINAPYDQNGYNTYLGSAIFQGAFCAQLCADACSQKSDYARAHPPTDGTPVQTCQVSLKSMYVRQETDETTSSSTHTSCMLTLRTMFRDNTV